MPVERHGSGAPWEATVGYSRVVRAGDLVLVAGTTATMPDGAIAGLGDPYLQTRQAIENVATRAGPGGRDAGRRRAHAHLRDRHQRVGGGRPRARRGLRRRAPVTAMVEVSALLDPRMLVEIEAEAWLGGGADAASAGARAAPACT